MHTISNQRTNQLKSQYTVFIKKSHLGSKMALNVHYSFNESPAVDLLHGTHILTLHKIY